MKIFQKEVKPMALLNVPELPFSKEDLKTFWQDGRATQPIVLRLITNHMGWFLAPVKGGGFVVSVLGEGHFILRSINKYGLMLAPPCAYGVGRSLSPGQLKEAVSKVDGFLVYDAREILTSSKIMVYKLSSAYIRMLLAIEEIWENSGRVRLKNIELDEPEPTRYGPPPPKPKNPQLTDTIDAEIVE